MVIIVVVTSLDVLPLRVTGFKFRGDLTRRVFELVAGLKSLSSSFVASLEFLITSDEGSYLGNIPGNNSAFNGGILGQDLGCNTESDDGESETRY
jgi:hypothetical protein